MKRKPIEIVSEILHYLQTIPPKSKITLSDVSNSTKTHYETIKEYVNLIQLVQINAPAIIYYPKDRKIEIHTYPRIFHRFSIEEQIILELYLNKRFDYGSAELLRNLSVRMSAEAIYEEIKTSDYFQIILLEDNIDRTMIYLRNKGKLKAHGLLSSIHRDMGKYIEYEIVPINITSKTQEYELEKEVIKPIDINYELQYNENNQNFENAYLSNYLNFNEPLLKNINGLNQRKKKETPMDNDSQIITSSTFA